MPVRPYGLMFHHFRGGGPPAGQGALRAVTFGRLLERVGRERILPARLWLERAIDGTLGPDDLCLTFDDNLRSQFDVAVPVLRELGLTGFFFVQTGVLAGEVERVPLYSAFQLRHFDHIDAFYDAFERRVAATPGAGDVATALATFEPAAYLAEYGFYSDRDRRFRYLRDDVLGPARYTEIMDAWLVEAGVDFEAWRRELWMDVDCLRTLLRAGHIIGLHSHTHPTRLVALSPAAQRAEYNANRDSLRSLLGVTPVVAAHPCNSYDANTLAILRELGVQIAFRSNTVPLGDDPLQWPREDCANLLSP